MATKRVKLLRTATEWELIEKKISESGKSNFNAFMRSEINRIKLKYEECKLCVTPAEGDRIQKEHFLDEETYKMFEEISKRMRKPVASVINDFIIAPLLRP
jgi:hypothetical protein